MLAPVYTKKFEKDLARAKIKRERSRQDQRSAKSPDQSRKSKPPL